MTVSVTDNVVKFSRSEYHSENVNNHEQYSKFNSLLNHKNRPLAVIVAPSRELAKQIYETAISINKAATPLVADSPKIFKLPLNSY